MEVADQKPIFLARDDVEGIIKEEDKKEKWNDSCKALAISC